MPKITLAAALLALMVSSAEGAERRPTARTTAETIDFQAFLEISAEVLEARSDRLLPLEEFLALAAEPDTVLLDTRSASAYASKHLAGAVHLSFSDLTEATLSRTVGPRDRVVLIYCNNNFSDDRSPFTLKQPPAALNIPTFVSLWTYGYRNVYELGELVEQSDPRLAFAGLMAKAGS